MVVNIEVPRGWTELDGKQLRMVYELLALGEDAQELKVLCLLKWAGIKVAESRGRKVAEQVFHLRMGKVRFAIGAAELAVAAQALDWLERLPEVPVRPEAMGRHKAMDAGLRGVPLETLLVVDNLYQGYLYTKRDELLDELGQVLYDWEGKEFRPWQRVAVFYWVAALKDWLARRYPTFYRTAAGDSLGGTPSPKAAEEAMNVQIRALTKGDITKEREVLAMDCHRALAELEAQAREYEEMRRRYKH